MSKKAETSKTALKKLSSTSDKMKKAKVKECDCIKTAAESVQKHVTDQRSKEQKGFQVTDGEWKNKSWYPTTRLYAPFNVTSTFQKVDGSTSKPKKEEIPVFFSFCPFCGKEYIKS